MDFIFDSRLALYLPLYELDGGAFKSKDAYGHPCTVIGALWTPQGRSFDGDDFVDCGAPTVITNLNIGTIEQWLYRSGTNVFYAGDQDAGVFQNEFYIFTHQIVIATGGSALVRLDFTAPLINQWTHFVVTSDGSTIKVYFDTVEQSLSVISGTNSGQWLNDISNVDRISIGANFRNNAISTGGTGKHGEVRIYSRVLTSPEIQHNYLATKWRYQ